jgi:hypothetical protein
MRQGLIAQWHTGIAVRGLAGACLLMIPVLMAAAIGFGGVGSGLSSLATGPSDSTVGAGLQFAGHGNKGGNLERISAALTSTRLAEKSHEASAPGGTSGSGTPGAAPGTGGSQPEQSGQSAGSNSPSSGGVGGGDTTTPAPSDNVSVPASSPDMLNQLLQGLGLAPAQ